MLKKIVAVLALMGFVGLGFVGLVGCNTMEGVGQDIQKGGKKIEDAADKHK